MGRVVEEDALWRGAQTQAQAPARLWRHRSCHRRVFLASKHHMQEPDRTAALVRVDRRRLEHAAGRVVAGRCRHRDVRAEHRPADEQRAQDIVAVCRRQFSVKYMSDGAIIDSPVGKLAYMYRALSRL